MLVRLVSLIAGALVAVMAAMPMAATASGPVPVETAPVDPVPVRIGLVKFGTVAWEMDTIRQHGLDEANGVRISVVEMATNDSGKIALQAGAVDLIVSDWPWVARQRAEGADFSFAPYSKAVGALLTGPQSGIAGLADLPGKRIGVAGGPLDKSWLLLRALSRKELGFDLADRTELVFGAPPLLNQEFAQGRIDAVLTYWHYAARLEAEGAKTLLTVADIARKLGNGADIPMLGFVFRESWAAQHEAALQGFLRASRQAKALLANSDAEWVRLGPLLGTDTPSVRTALKAGYSAGILDHWGEEERRNAEALYGTLAALGGDKLVGRAKTLDPGTFWPLGAD
jgi:NitT/TauT family transport system substrate-binding protein